MFNRNKILVNDKFGVLKKLVSKYVLGIFSIYFSILKKLMMLNFDELWNYFRRIFKNRELSYGIIKFFYLIIDYYNIKIFLINCIKICF